MKIILLLTLSVIVFVACKPSEYNNGVISENGDPSSAEGEQSPTTPPSKVILNTEDLRFLVVAHSGPNPPGIRWVMLRATPNGPYPVDYGKICSYKIDGLTDFTGYTPQWEGIPTTELSGNIPAIVGATEGVARPNWWADDVFGLFTPSVDYGVVVAYSTSPTHPILVSLECNRL